ncbi:MAG TPA: AAA family ATPase [Spirochaetota bacterium]|nr:AAA family ATPase [Spirochaetota bacterium]
MESVLIDGKEIFLSSEEEISLDFVKRDEPLRQLLASWILINDKDYPLHPRIVGKPGVGKTSIGMAASVILNLPLYIFQATQDTRPEDLIITPVIADKGKIRYVASPLVSAVIKGGVCILDEGNRMSEKSWASLASLLDHRRTVYSIIAGVKIKAHPNFRFCSTMNEDASTFDIPEYIESRLQPMIHIDFPFIEEEIEILKNNIPYAEDDLIMRIANFLQESHRANLPFSIRDGINIARYTVKWTKQNGGKIEKNLEQSVLMICGDLGLSVLNPTFKPTNFFDF